ncbi:hypothetical protein Dsin_007892 [Dipteronia sinensis]|uniref:Uncharacterized protein n=1 Tax=Dipteronia sinensis TaxID=43782 RepID=A0AAE0B2C7_9ROSI|nr:hypothetical protein Dsin_007892 [Dipteronia sinensis]
MLVVYSFLFFILGTSAALDTITLLAWVANRETSLTDHSGFLNVTQQGILVLLDGMKLGRNFFTGLDKNLSSWKSLEDPAPGQISQWIDPHGFPQLMSRLFLNQS